VLVVDEGGKQVAFASGLVDLLLNKGLIVLAIDYRGAGETAGTVPAIGYGPGTPEYNLTNYSLFVGRPLAGARVMDIRCATDFLAGRAEVDAERIAIAGRGRGALSAVLAASFDDRLRCVVADELLTSWVFDEEFVDIGLAYFIPRILTLGDMSQLLAHLVPRPLLVANPVDGRRRTVAIDDCRRQLQFTSGTYELLDARDKLQVSHGAVDEMAARLVEWLHSD
jgi:hypothetical protein